jgi:hypothetical protein
MCKNCTLLNSSTHNQEIDKNIENFTMSDTMLDGNLTFQSPTPSNGVFTRVTTTGRLSGWPLNGKFTDSTFKGTLSADWHHMAVGPTGYGHANNNSFNNVGFASAQLAKRVVHIAWMTYNKDGTFTIAKSHPNYHEVIAWAVPGFQYAFANLDGTLNSVPKTSFTINDVTDQGTSIKIWTTLPNVLPTPSCDGTPCPMLQPYAGGVITQTPPGVPTDLTQFAPPQ